MALSAASARPHGASNKSTKRNSQLSSRSHKPTHALLSIKPRYSDAIFRGEKSFEFRRAIFRQPVKVVVVYTTSPICRVVGEFDVQSIITDTIAALWRRTKQNAGIDRERFFGYFAGCEVGHAIVIGRPRKYSRSLNLADAFGVRPPQSFLYLASQRRR